MARVVRYQTLVDILPYGSRLEIHVDTRLTDESIEHFMGGLDIQDRVSVKLAKRIIEVGGVEDLFVRPYRLSIHLAPLFDVKKLAPKFINALSAYLDDGDGVKMKRVRRTFLGSIKSAFDSEFSSICDEASLEEEEEE